jgi:ammonium transporter, Amt family
VSVPASIIIGLGAGGICFFGVELVKQRFGVDDALDVVGVHGIGGTWGALATGLFATVAVNSAGANGLFYGNPQQLLTQAIAVAISWIYSCVMTFIILKAVDALIGIRVPEAEEVLGLDTTQHGEIAYQL